MRLVVTPTIRCKWCMKIAMPGKYECYTCRKERVERENPDEGRSYRS